MPGRFHPGPVLGHWLQDTLKTKVYPVHRLDVQTSGLVLFATTPEAHASASKWFEKRQIEKTYLALVSGTLGAPVRVVSTPIRDKPARTQIETLWTDRKTSYCRVRPLTGRRHQIRIHLSSIGCPLLGDIEYGGPSTWGGLSVPRVALHSFSLNTLLADQSPSAQPPWEAPLWEDMELWKNKLQLL